MKTILSILGKHTSTLLFLGVALSIVIFTPDDKISNYHVACMVLLAVGCITEAIGNAMDRIIEEIRKKDEPRSNH